MRALLEQGRSVVGTSRSAEYPDCMLAYKDVDHSGFEFHQLDLRTNVDAVVELVRSHSARQVVNFAAQGEIRSSFEDPESHYATNAMAMVRLAERLKSIEGFERYVHVSTPEVYGSTGESLPESRTFNPSSPYAASKACADLHNMVLFKTEAFPVVTIRSTNVFGPHQQLYRIVPRMVIMIKSGEKLTLDGGGKARKSYIHIQDVCDGMICALERGRPGEVYHFGPEKDAISIRYVVETVCRLMNVDFNDYVTIGPERPGQDALYSIDSTKARSEFGWSESRSFEDGVQETIDWINRDWETIKGLPHHYQHKP